MLCNLDLYVSRSEPLLVYEHLSDTSSSHLPKRSDAQGFAKPIVGQKELAGLAVGRARCILATGRRLTRPARASGHARADDQTSRLAVFALFMGFTRTAGFCGFSNSHWSSPIESPASSRRSEHEIAPMVSASVPSPGSLTMPSTSDWLERLPAAAQATKSSQDGFSSFR